MKHFLQHWQEITTDSVILSCVHGYDIEFDEEKPIQYSRSKTKYICSNSTEELLLGNEISKLWEKNVLEETSHSQGEFISSVFLRPKPDGSFRMILNLKNLNESVKYYHF